MTKSILKTNDPVEAQAPVTLDRSVLKILGVFRKAVIVAIYKKTLTFTGGVVDRAGDLWLLPTSSLGGNEEDLSLKAFSLSLSLALVFLSCTVILFSLNNTDSIIRGLAQQ